MAVYGIPEPLPGAGIQLSSLPDDKTLAAQIRNVAAMLTDRIKAAKQAGLSVDVQWRLEDDMAEITIVREY